MNQKQKGEKTDVTKALFSGNLSPITPGGVVKRPTSTRGDGGSNSIIVQDTDEDFFNIIDRKKNSKLRLSTRDPQESY